MPPQHVLTKLLSAEEIPQTYESCIDFVIDPSLSPTSNRETFLDPSKFGSTAVSSPSNSTISTSSSLDASVWPTYTTGTSQAAVVPAGQDTKTVTVSGIPTGSILVSSASSTHFSILALTLLLATVVGLRLT